MTATDAPPRWDLTPIFGGVDDRTFNIALEGVSNGTGEPLSPVAYLLRYHSLGELAANQYNGLVSAIGGHPFADISGIWLRLACAAGVINREARKLTVAIGMIPRGEVTLVFAALGGTLRVGGVPLLDERGYTALVTVVILTTLLAPPALKWSLGTKAGAGGRPSAAT